jgi:hypothetical protein
MARASNKLHGIGLPITTIAGFTGLAALLPRGWVQLLLWQKVIGE